MKVSAGILLYRKGKAGFEVLVVHPGGPFWAKKDLASWSIPKGEFVEGEEPLVAAKREFCEETGATAPEGTYQPLGEVKQPSGKTVYIWACQADFDVRNFKSNTFEMEWPPKSGTLQSFPECDRAAWVPLSQAQSRLVKGQVSFIDRLIDHLGITMAVPPEQSTLF